MTGPQMRCQHFRSYEMYFESSSDPQDPYASGEFSCLKTHDTIGPDGQPVDCEECRSTRDCFQELGG